MEMRKLKINGLSAKSLEDAAKAIDKYQLEIALKNKEYVRALAKEGIDEASNHLTFKGDAEPPQIATQNPHVMLGKSEGQMKAVVRLKGDDVVFVEFGAGIHYNTPVGTSPNPYGVELGYTIGSYSDSGNGYSLGQYDWWSHIDKNGVRVVTHGTEAAMPLYHASERIRQKAREVAKSVFRS